MLVGGIAALGTTIQPAHMLKQLYFCACRGHLEQRRALGAKKSLRLSATKSSMLRLMATEAVNYLVAGVVELKNLLFTATYTLCSV